ncbi:hypothetical protein [Candidatus Poriferisodalis sp.]|uniref:hypothetical protein n=1 Tax=Candidatus Poriferisodalis sp. TaxID=3101277 RepID=UPI003B02D93B
MLRVDPLFAIYRGRADKLLAEFWAVHLVAAAIVGVLVALFTGVGWWALPIALPAACALAAVELAVGERRLHRALIGAGLGPSDAGSQPRLENVVNGVCLLVGVPVPALAVAPRSAANATVFGRRPDRSTLVVTQGLLDALNRIELEAVVARLLTQIRDGRAAYLTTAVTTVGLPALLWPALWPLVQARTEREASTGSDFDDDAEAVRLTRYPPGLADALETMSAAGVRTDAPRVTWPLWLADPRADSSIAPDSLPDYRADLETRVAVLREF